MATVPGQMGQFNSSLETLTLPLTALNPLQFKLKTKTRNFSGNKLIFGAGISLALGWILTLLSILLLPTTLCRKKRDVLIIIAYSSTFVSLCLLFLAFSLFVAYIKRVGEFLKDIDTQSVGNFRYIPENERTEPPFPCTSQCYTEEGVAAMAPGTKETEFIKYTDSPKNGWVLKPSNVVKSVSTAPESDYEVQNMVFTDIQPNPLMQKEMVQKELFWDDISNTNITSQGKRKPDLFFDVFRDSNAPKNLFSFQKTDKSDFNNLTFTDLEVKEKMNEELTKKSSTINPKRSSMPAAINRRRSSVAPPTIKRLSVPEQTSRKKLSLVSGETNPLFDLPPLNENLLHSLEEHPQSSNNKDEDQKTETTAIDEKTNRFSDLL